MSQTSEMTQLLGKAIDQKDEKAGQAICLLILTQVLDDLHRVADSLQILALKDQKKDS